MKGKIKYIKGNIFTSQAQTLVNTVNCVGVMGAGIALEFKYRYPDMFEKYVRYCQDGLIQTGKLWIYDVLDSNTKILNFPTKQHWKYPSKFEYLQKGLSRFVETYKEKGITSAAFPMLGALNGGLDPDKVLELMTGYLDLCDIPIEIYEYDSESKDDLIDGFKKYFLNNEVKLLEKKTGFKLTLIKKLKDILLNDNLISLIQLDKIKGIGNETVKDCFKLAMLIKLQSISVPDDIFSGQIINSFSQETEETQNKLLKTIPERKRKQSAIHPSNLNSIDNSHIDSISEPKLFIVYCGYYDKVSGGVYESKMNLFVVAENLEMAQFKARSAEQVKQYNMHIDSVQEVEMIEGFILNFKQTGTTETRVHNHIFRELV